MKIGLTPDGFKLIIERYFLDECKTHILQRDGHIWFCIYCGLCIEPKKERKKVNSTGNEKSHAEKSFRGSAQHVTIHRE